ncbi:MAG: glycosyltransferase family 2 protein [Bacteroidota bacterium]|nr:glycosyltransferase family 2 protein [Bacteroidota bacterium]
MNQDPQVSIIIPFLDEVHFLTEAVHSALDQNLNSFEIIVVCNAKELSTVDKTDPPLSHDSIVWLHEPVPGAQYARNKGLTHARGEWIQFLDVDDILLPGKIPSQLKMNDADAIVSPTIYRYVNGSEIESAWYNDDIWYSLLASQLGSTSSMLWKRSMLNEINGWSKDYNNNQEHELLFRILIVNGRIAFDNSRLTIVRQRVSGSITQSKHNHPLTGIRLRELIWKYLRSEGLDTENRLMAFRNYVFKNLRGVFRYDPAMAVQLHNLYFLNSRFAPAIKGVPGYLLIYRTFGFQKTESLMGIYRLIRNRLFPWLPKNE